MLKHSIALIALSIIVVLTMPYAQPGLQFIVSAQTWVSETLTAVFSGGEVGNLIRNVIALLVIPVVIGLIPAFIYWLVKRSWFPYFMEVVWFFWLVQTAALVIQYKGTVAAAI
jgi:hypothetical protein